MKTGTAAFAAPLVAGQARAASTDVVVIGAGAAGLAATRDLRASGLDVTLIEADSRIGGRVKTDTDIFGQPYDLGAHWLHIGTQNAFVDYGRAQGFDIYRAPETKLLYVDGAPADKTTLKSYKVAEKAALKKISKAGRKGRDVAPADVIPDLGDWAATVDLTLGAYEMAKDFNRFSCADWYTSDDGPDFYCREGFGTLVAHSAQDTAVSLDTTAQLIRWSGPGVEVETNRGTLTARAMIITVSMGVLAHGKLRFDPPLPAEKEGVLDDLTMGHYNHIALKFDENFFGLGSDGYFSHKVTAGSNGVPQGFIALVDAGGTGISYCDVGGAFAQQLSQAGDGAALDFVLTQLRDIFGSKVTQAVQAHHVYDWSSDPLTLGAYASAEPGGAGARDALRKPMGEKIWFAGEATSDAKWATVAGAHDAGRVAAAQVLKALT